MTAAESPNPESLSVAPVPLDHPAGRRWARWAAWLVGVLLLSAAFAALWRHQATLSQAWGAARGAPPWMLAALIVAPAVNIIVVSLSFSVMTGRYGRVGRAEMMALITSAWLLNHLPLRPGLVGRFAYHTFVNGIPIAACVRVALEVIVCAAVSLLSLLAFAVGAAALGAPGWAIGWGGLALPGVCFSAAALIRSRGRGENRAQRWLWCVGLRQVDLIVWIVRYALVFAALGSPLTWLNATVVAAASQAAMLLPVQVGLREWVVGVVSAQFASAPGLELASVTPGLLADVLTRGVEVAVSLPAGIAATLWIRRRIGESTRNRTVPPSVAV